MKNLSIDLREHLRLLIRSLGILEKYEASCCGITIGQCHAIVEIGREVEISLNELAKLLRLDKSTMSRTVNNLVKQSLVERTINQDDRRYMKISLTEKGNEIFDEIEESMKIYYKDILEEIPKDKRNQVVESLQILLEAMNRSKCC